MSNETRDQFLAKFLGISVEQVAEERERVWFDMVWEHMYLSPKRFGPECRDSLETEK